MTFARRQLLETLSNQVDPVSEHVSARLSQRLRLLVQVERDGRDGTALREGVRLDARRGFGEERADLVSSANVGSEDRVERASDGPIGLAQRLRHQFLFPP